jgi:excinuclease UvrABC nuclease subunit
MSIISDHLKKLPDTPGVYFFMGKRKEILYVGKATSLKGSNEEPRW